MSLTTGVGASSLNSTNARQETQYERTKRIIQQKKQSSQKNQANFATHSLNPVMQGETQHERCKRIIKEKSASSRINSNESQQTGFPTTVIGETQQERCKRVMKEQRSIQGTQARRRDKLEVKLEANLDYSGLPSQPLNKRRKTDLGQVLDKDTSIEATAIRLKIMEDDKRKRLKLAMSGNISPSLRKKIDGVSLNNTILRDKEHKAIEKAKMHPHIATATATRTKQEQLLKATQGKQRTAAPIAYKEHLLKLAYRRGMEILKEQNVSVRGWTKEVAPLVSHAAKGSIGLHFNQLAGWGDNTIDTFDPGIRALANDTARNRVSQVTGFLL